MSQQLAPPGDEEAEGGDCLIPLSWASKLTSSDSSEPIASVIVKLTEQIGQMVKEGKIGVHSVMTVWIGSPFGAVEAFKTSSDSNRGGGEEVVTRFSCAVSEMIEILLSLQREDPDGFWDGGQRDAALRSLLPIATEICKLRRKLERITMTLEKYASQLEKSKEIIAGSFLKAPPGPSGTELTSNKGRRRRRCALLRRVLRYALCSHSKRGEDEPKKKQVQDANEIPEAGDFYPREDLKRQDDDPSVNFKSVVVDADPQHHHQLGKYQCDSGIVGNARARESASIGTTSPTPRNFNGIETNNNNFDTEANQRLSRVVPPHLFQRPTAVAAVAMDPSPSVEPGDFDTFKYDPEEEYMGACSWLRFGDEEIGPSTSETNNISSQSPSVSVGSVPAAAHFPSACEPDADGAEVENRGEKIQSQHSDVGQTGGGTSYLAEYENSHRNNNENYSSPHLGETNTVRSGLTAGKDGIRAGLTADEMNANNERLLKDPELGQQSKEVVVVRSAISALAESEVGTVESEDLEWLSKIEEDGQTGYLCAEDIETSERLKRQSIFLRCFAHRAEDLLQEVKASLSMIRSLECYWIDSNARSGTVTTAGGCGEIGEAPDDNYMATRGMELSRLIREVGKLSKFLASSPQSLEMMRTLVDSDKASVTSHMLRVQSDCVACSKSFRRFSKMVTCDTNFLRDLCLGLIRSSSADPSQQIQGRTISLQVLLLDFEHHFQEEEGYSNPA